MTAALVALLMLSFASVQSIVMQATMPPSGDMTPLCGDLADKAPPASEAMSMPGMDMDQAIKAAAPSHEHHSGASHGHKSSCPYCAAASHAPILGNAIPLRHAVGFVFTAFRVVASHGPRGPPACQPRARGPPVDPLTA